MSIDITNIEGGISFCVKIVPGSSRTSIEGALGNMLKIKVAAAPEKGKANKELTAFLAKKLGVRKSDIEITSGKTNPVKTIEIKNIDANSVVSIIDN
ncbi:MAG: DUF167 domain-containing protein [Sedimentisphaeraceae bacterium JB056]